MLQRVFKGQIRLTKRVVIGLLLMAATIVWGGNYLANASPVLAGNNVRYFAVVAVTEAEADDGQIQRIGLAGNGTFDPDTGWVRGGGTFEQFDFGASGLPKPALGSAKWVIRRVVEFTPCMPPDTCTTSNGVTAGHITPGVIDFAVDLHFDDGRTIRRARLKLICNVGFAGIINKDPDTGDPLPEGYFLTFTDPDYGLLEFKPLDPVLGLTHIGYIPPQELR